MNTHTRETFRTWQSRPRDSVRMDSRAEADLAWDLADSIDHLLSDHDRAQIYITIGAGSAYAAIATMLGAIVRGEWPVSPPLAVRIADWLRAYTYSDDAARLRKLLDAVGTFNST